MQSLIVDTGVEAFTLNGRGPLRFNPGDPNVYHRFFEAKETLEEMGTSLRSALDDLAAAGEPNAPRKAWRCWPSTTGRSRRCWAGCSGRRTILTRCSKG